ncbi:hypothetical protein ACKVMT_03375 [Halobacteriales archaeon Cl-PHB]
MEGGRSSGGLPVTKLKLSLVALVAVSAAMVSLQVDAELTTVVAALALGTVVGVALVWIAFPSIDEETRKRTRR